MFLLKVKTKERKQWKVGEVCKTNKKLCLTNVSLQNQAFRPKIIN